MTDEFVDEMVEAFHAGPDPAWGPWYAEHGGPSGVTFLGDDGVRYGIPSFIDSLRFDEWKRGGLQAMRDFDASMRAYLEEIRNGTKKIEFIPMPPEKEV